MPDLDNAACGARSTDPSCNLCASPANPSPCPGISYPALRTTRVFLYAPPSVTLVGGHIFDVPNDELTLFSRVTVPDKTLDGGVTGGCRWAMEMPEVKSLQDADKGVPFTWSVSEIVLQQGEHTGRLTQDWDAIGAKVTSRMAASVQLSPLGIYTQANFLTLPSSLLKPQHYYLVTLDVVQDVRRGSSSMVLHIRRKPVRIRFTLRDLAKGSTFELNDNSLVNVQGTVGERFEVSTLPLTTGLTDLQADVSVTYAWECLMVLGRASYTYWKEDTLFSS